MFEWKFVLWTPKWPNDDSKFVEFLKAVRPLKMKQAKDVTNMIANIYKVGPLIYPKVFQCDNGSEFKAGVTKMLENME